LSELGEIQEPARDAVPTGAVQIRQVTISRDGWTERRRTRLAQGPREAVFSKENAFWAADLAENSRPRRRGRRNPAEVVLRCLRAPDVDARVVEGLWILVVHANLDWTWLVRHAKAGDLQNRLGFLVSMAVEAAQREGQAEARAQLTSARAALERSGLAAEGAFRAAVGCRATVAAVASPSTISAHGHDFPIGR